MSILFIITTAALFLYTLYRHIIIPASVRKQPWYSDYQTLTNNISQIYTPAQYNKVYQQYTQFTKYKPSSKLHNSCMKQAAAQLKIKKQQVNIFLTAV